MRWEVHSVVSPPLHARSSIRRSPSEREPDWWVTPPPSGPRPSLGELVVWLLVVAAWAVVEPFRRPLAAAGVLMSCGVVALSLAVTLLDQATP